jgi:hypothetical protein
MAVAFEFCCVGSGNVTFPAAVAHCLPSSALRSVARPEANCPRWSAGEITEQGR